MCEDPEPDKPAFPDLILISDPGDESTVRRIADELSRRPGSILIVGHHDGHAALSFAFLSSSITRSEHGVCLSIRHERVHMGHLFSAAMLGRALCMPLPTPEVIARQRADEAAMAQTLKSIADTAFDNYLELPPIEEKPYARNQGGIFALQAKDRKMQAYKENRDRHMDRRFR